MFYLVDASKRLKLTPVMEKIIKSITLHCSVPVGQCGKDGWNLLANSAS
jgi:hypothetical protein